MMRCQVLTNANYHADKYVEFDPAEVISIEEKTMRILFGGKHRVTIITLQGGRRYILVGELAAQIEAERQKAAPDKDIKN
jgi:hypothetical protein